VFASLGLEESALGTTGFKGFGCWKVVFRFFEEGFGFWRKTRDFGFGFSLAFPL